MPGNISTEEWRVMQVLWERNDNLTSAEIVQRMEDHRSPRTIKTHLQRLVSKGFVDFTVDAEDSRIYHYFAKVNEDECIRKENKNFASLYYKGNVGGLLARFIGDSDLTARQIQELTDLLDAKKEDAK